MSCVEIPSDTGQVGRLNEACQHYCCPSTPTLILGEAVREEEESTVAAQPGAAPSQDTGGIVDWVKGAIGMPTGQQVPAAPMPGGTGANKPTAQGFATYAQEAALRTGAAAENEVLPIEETPPDSAGQQAAEEQTWIERYQTHITLASTAIGLGTFLVWLVIRKKD
jgi:hypothetical protein